MKSGIEFSNPNTIDSTQNIYDFILARDVISKKDPRFGLSYIKKSRQKIHKKMDENKNQNIQNEPYISIFMKYIIMKYIIKYIIMIIYQVYYYDYEYLQT